MEYIWIVIEESSNMIEAVFSTKEKADEYLMSLGEYHGCFIRKYEVNNEN